MSCSGVDRNDRACSQSSSLFLCPLSCLLSQPDSSIPTIPFCFSWHRRLQRSASRCSKSAVIAARSKPISIPDSSILVFFFYQQIVYKSAKRRDATRRDAVSSVATPLAANELWSPILSSVKRSRLRDTRCFRVLLSSVAPPHW